MDTVTRNNYARLFDGIYEDIADTIPSKNTATVFDRTYMPALLIEDGKQIFHSFTMAVNESQVIQLPQDYDDAQRLYIAIQVNGKAKVALVSPTHGSSAVLLDGLDTDADGTHNAFYSHQGDITSVTISTPTALLGGTTTEVKVFMYELPDLEVATSYFDKQIGLGVTEQV